MTIYRIYIPKHKKYKDEQHNQPEENKYGNPCKITPLYLMLLIFLILTTIVTIAGAIFLATNSDDLTCH